MTLVDHSDDPAEKEFFTRLQGKVEEEQELLRSLLAKVGDDGGSLLEAFGSLTAKAGRLKLAWEDLDAGGLGRFEAVEILAVGIQGKWLLWRMLGTISALVPEWDGVDFPHLEAAALAQQNEVESRRVEMGRAALTAGRKS